MPKSYTVTLYKNTGFNTGNIPDSPSVLSSATSITVDAVFEWQSRSLANIRVKANWDTIKDVDYCAITNGTDVSYYVVTGVNMRSGVTAELQMTLDPLNTAGGVSGITVLSGWAKRAHASSDTIFDNIIPEPWAPSNRLVIRNKTVIHDNPSGFLNVAIATCNLWKAASYEAQIATVADSAGTEQGVVWPQLPMMYFPDGSTQIAEGTEVTFTERSGTGRTYTMPGLFAFNMELDDIKEGINAVRSIGIESAISAMYVIPTDDVAATMTQVSDTSSNVLTNFISSLTGQVENYSPDMPYIYASANNKKALALYSGFVVTSLASGDSKSYSAYDLYAGGTAPAFAVLCDPSPDGTVYCQPTYYEGSATQKLEQAVASSPWYNAGFTYMGASGASIMQMNAARAQTTMTLQQDFAQQGFNLQNKQNSLNAVEGFIGNLTGAIGGAATGNMGAVGQGLAGLVTGAADAELAYDQLALNSRQSRTMYERSMGDNIFNTNVQANVVAPTVAFPVTVSAANYFGHAFMITQTTLSNNDLARFDRFLTAYGYAQDRALVEADLNSRTHFNYVLATDVVLKSNTAPQWVLQLITDMFASGVRIWHEMPNAAAYSSNPIA